MNIDNNIIITEMSKGVCIMIVPIRDATTNNIVYKISFDKGEIEYIFDIAELHDITHIHFKYTDFSNNSFYINQTIKASSDIEIKRFVNSESDTILIVPKDSDKSLEINTADVVKVIDGYYYASEKSNEIINYIRTKYK